MGEPRWLTGGDAVLAIAPDRPTLWLVDIDEPAARQRAEAVAPLPGEAAAVAERRDAGERLVRRRLSRLMLAAAAGCRVDEVAVARSAAGAPIVAAPAGWHFGVAARWPLCLISVAPMSVGVDIEKVDGALPDDLLTRAERKSLARYPGDRHAAHCWAAKEAHAKWTGRPRDLDPAAIETATLPLVTSALGTTRCWLHDAGDHVAAVCTA